LSLFFPDTARERLVRCFILCPINNLKESIIMKPSAVISHIVLSLILVASIIVGFWGMNEHGVVPLFALLTLGGSFVLGTQLMLIVTGE
jgi:hypothetical protein